MTRDEPVARLLPGCFGKLPIHREYLRLHASSAEVQALKHWFDGGLQLARETLGAAWEERYERAAAVRFVFHAAGGEFPLAGVCAPGKDAIGRKYPFSIDLPVPGGYAGEPALTPLAFARFLEEAEELVSSGWEGSGAKEVLEKVEALPAEESPPIEVVRAAHREFLERERPSGVIPGAAPGAPLTERLLAVLKDVVRAGRRLDLTRNVMGLRIPLPAGSRGEALARQVAFWLELASRAGEPNRPLAIAFWSGRSPAGPVALFVFLGKLGAPQFLHLFHPSLQSDTLWDLGELVSGTEAGEVDRGEVAEEGEGSLAELLARVAPPPDRRVQRTRER